MGGKGDDSSSAPVVQTQQEDNNMEMYQAMLMAMMSQQQNMAQQMQAPQTMAMPAIQETKKIDYSDKVKQLNAKAKADYMADQSKRKRFVDMTHTSYLLDDEEPTTTKTVLT